MGSRVIFNTNMGYKWPWYPRTEELGKAKVTRPIKRKKVWGEAGRDEAIQDAT